MVVVLDLFSNDVFILKEHLIYSAFVSPRSSDSNCDDESFTYECDDISEFDHIAEVPREFKTLHRRILYTNLKIISFVGHHVFVLPLHRKSPSGTNVHEITLRTKYQSSGKQWKFDFAGKS